MAADISDGHLWMNGFSTKNGLNDHVPVSMLKKEQRSLYLLPPRDVQIVARTVRVPDSLPKRRVQASFSLNGIEYTLIVTDPAIRDKYLREKEGAYCIENAALCISLGEIYNGNAYKLVAAVITPDMGGAD
jgi:hypothetical protein